MTHRTSKANRFDRLWVKLVLAGLILGIGAAGSFAIKSKIKDIATAEVAAKVARQDIVYLAGYNSNDPDVGYRTVPYTWARQFYLDNPRNYFREETLADRMLIDWRVEWTSNIDAQVTPSAHTFPLHVNVHSKKEGLSGWEATFRNAPIDLPAGTDAKFVVRASAETPRIAYAVFWRGEDWANPLATTEISLEKSLKEFVIDFPKSKEDLKIVVGFGLGYNSGSLQIEELRIDGIKLPGVNRETKFFVDNIFNNWGYRDADWKLKPEKGCKRIACIGDSFTFAQGVRQGDRFSEGVLKLLKEQASPGERFEVLNFGMCGYSTNEEWELFRKDVVKFDPHIVVLTMCWNDGISFKEDRDLFDSLKGEPKKYEEEYAKRIRNVKYKTSVEAIEKIDSLCKSNGSQLVVGILNLVDSTEWKLLASEVIPAMKERHIPVFDVREELIAANCFAIDGSVHKTDLHPNEKAHAIYARKLAEVLEKEVLPKLSR